jgi:CO/xanthine dehydrogenase Mo-binding subunit
MHGRAAGDDGPKTDLGTARLIPVYVEARISEVTFDESGITVDDWASYPILTMADIPEIKVVLLNNPNVGKYGGGSEAANALAAPAIAAALHDATGKVLRRLPLKPAYVQAILKA